MKTALVKWRDEHKESTITDIFLFAASSITYAIVVMYV